jgi:hypothetical protein
MTCSRGYAGAESKIKMRDTFITLYNYLYKENELTKSV